MTGCHPTINDKLYLTTTISQIYIMKYLPIVFLLLIFSCNKTKNNQPEKELPQENIALLVDNSLSMIAQDFEPNRITVIKDVIKNIIDHKKENQAFSIVIFSKDSYVLCPLTKDKNQLLSAIHKLDAGILKMRPGTSFSHVLLNGMRSLNSEFDNKSMILFSDGKETVKSYPLDVVIQDAVKNNIRINSIMMTPKDFAILPASMDSQGNIQFTKTKAEKADSIWLKKIASETGGIFKLFYTKDAIEKFNFSQMIAEKKKAQVKKTSSKTNDDEMSKIYKQIEISNDSVAAVFKR
jgi:hypothetical protein